MPYRIDLDRRTLLARGGTLALALGAGLGPAETALAASSRQARAVTADLPRPPAGRSATTGVLVRTQAELAAALAATTASEIVLADGIYASDAAIAPAAPHRLRARSAPRGGSPSVTLRYGLMWGNHAGFAVSGIAFVIDDPAHAATDGAFAAAILNWFGGVSRDASISDCTIDGGFAVTQGINLGSPDGARIERCRITRCTDQGIRASDNQERSTAVIDRIADIDVSAVYRAPRGSADGTAEAGVWIGHRVRNGVERLRIRDTGWMGLWTGNRVVATRFRHLTIDGCFGTIPAGSHAGRTESVGIYVERFTGLAGDPKSGSTFERFELGPDLLIGIDQEWDHDLPGNQASSYNVFRDGIIDCSSTRAVDAANARSVGIVCDQGTLEAVVSNVRFRNQTFAAIFDPSGSVRTSGLSVAGIASGAAVSTREHP